jgi:hypothetical protein
VRRRRFFVGLDLVYNAHVFPVQSPLFMAIDDPVLHRFISYLAEKKQEQEQDPEKHIQIELTHQMIAHVRGVFRQNILEGERKLHSLAHILAQNLFEEDFELHSNVIGLLPDDDDDERPFLIREKISRQTLFSLLDIDLGNQMLDNFRYNLHGEWIPLGLSANFVEYIPVRNPGTGVNRLTSRVKAEEEIWNKVTDEIFQVDQLVSRDKHLQRFSKYVKDIFGIKVICEDDATCLHIHDKIEGLELQENERLEFIETKNYLTCEPARMKKTGWKALKSVVCWHDRLFELQVQPLGNYYLELDHMSGPSHSNFKIRRDDFRHEIAKALPLYGFYRDLLRMLFRDGESICFEANNASVIIS